jgi:hypothetical protein
MLMCSTVSVLCAVTINIGLAQISASYLATRLPFISHPLQTFAVTNDKVTLLPAQEICQHF